MFMTMQREVVSTLADMAVRMHVPKTGAMAVHMDMHALKDDSAQDIGTQDDEHKADQQFERQLHMPGNTSAEPEHRAAEQHQGQRMADAPDDAQSHGLCQRTPALSERRDRGEVIGFTGMLDAQQQAEQQDRKRAHGAASRALTAALCSHSQ